MEGALVGSLFPVCAFASTRTVLSLLCPAASEARFSLKAANSPRIERKFAS